MGALHPPHTHTPTHAMSTLPHPIPGWCQQLQVVA